MNDETPPTMTATAGNEPERRARAVDAGWQRTLIEELARDALVERRRARRWRIFFRLAGVALVLLVVIAAFGWLRPSDVGGGRHTALIEIDGVIAAGGEVDADIVTAALRDAFKDRQTA